MESAEVSESSTGWLVSSMTGSSGFDTKGVRVNSDWTGDDTTEGKTSSDLSEVDGSGVEGGSGGVGETASVVRAA